MAFSLISSSDRTKSLKGGLNKQRKAVEYYVNQGKLYTNVLLVIKLII